MAATLTFATGASGAFKDVAFSPTGATAYVSDKTGWVTAFNVATGAELGRWKVGTSLTGMDVSPDGRYLIAGELGVTNVTGETFERKGTGTIHRLDLQTGEVKDFTTQLEASSGGFYDVAWGKDGKILTTQTYTRWMSTLDPATGQFATLDFTDTYQGVLSVSDDRSKILLGPQNSSAGAIYVYDTATGAMSRIAINDGYNNGMQAISTSAGMLAQALASTIKVYDLNARLIVDIAKGHPDLARYTGGVEFSADGSKLFVLDTRHDRVLQFSTSDWMIERSIALGTDAGESFVGTGAFGDRLTLTGDGRYLVALSAAGHALTDGAKTVTSIDLQGVWDTGSDKADIINGDSGPNKLFGYGGDDVINGGAGNDELYGGDGNDILVGGEGDDRLYGGEGIDTADYGAASGGVTVYLAGYPQVVGAAGRDILDSIENVRGSAFADKLSGDEGVNLLEGGDGADILNGRGGADVLSGGAGDDVLMGGSGDDALDGGSGFDIASYEDAVAGVSVDLSKLAVFQNTKGSGSDVLTSIEGLRGSAFGDVLRGSAFDNSFEGGRGDDFIDGGAGFDTAIYSGASGDYSWTRNANGAWTVKDLRGLGRDGVDTLLNVEALKFTDKTVLLEPSTASVTLADLLPASSVNLVASGQIASAVLSASGAVIYVASERGEVVALNAATGEATGRWAVGSQLGGMDLSRDGRYLVAAERSVSTSGDQTTLTAHLLDLQTGLVTHYTTTVKGEVRGFHDAAFTSDNKVVFTSQPNFGGSIPQVWLDLSTRTFNSGPQYTYLTPAVISTVDDDGKYLLGIGNVSDAPLYLHTVGSTQVLSHGSYADNVSGYSNGVQAIAGNGAWIAQLAGGLHVYDGSLKYVVNLSKSYPEIGYNVLGMDFSPDGSRLFVVDADADRILEFSTSNWSLTRAYSLGVDIGVTSQLNSYAGNYGDRVTVSADGKRMIITDDLKVISVDLTTLKADAVATGPGTYKTISLAVESVLRDVSTVGASISQDLWAKVSAGQMTLEQATRALVDTADATTSVASMSYQFFTGKIPGMAGFDFLISPTGANTTNLNSEVYAKFNTVNRYINFAMNLGKFGEAKDSFAAAYGGLTLFEATKKAYGVIFGATPSDAKVAQLLDGRIAFLASFSGDPAEGIGTKAAMVGFLLAAAATENVGVIARSNDAWLLDVADGSALYAVNLVDPANGYYKADFIYGG